MKYPTLFFAALSLASMQLAQAESALNYTPLKAGFIHSFESDADGGGAFSKNEFFLGAGAPLITEQDLTLALTFGYGIHSYDFDTSAAGSFAALSPWDDIHTYRLGAFFRWQIDDKWTLIATPKVRSTAESSASISDSLTYGSNVALQYKYSDTLTIGTGLGVSSQIEDSTSFYPLLVIDWQISDSLSLSTSPPTGTNFGPSLTMQWDICDTQRLSWGVSYQRTRFRLDTDNLAASEGVGEESGIPLFANYTWKPTDNLQASVIAGVRIGTELELTDRNGNILRTDDTDPVPFLGLSVGYSF